MTDRLGAGMHGGRVALLATLERRVNLPRAHENEAPAFADAAFAGDATVGADSWVLSDAWVLAAARVSGTMESRGGLFDLVAACDAVNHLIVSREELEHAMSMLVGAGLMVADEHGIAVTEQGRALVARAGRSLVNSTARRNSEARIAALFGFLRQWPVTPDDFELDPATYEAACLEYRHTRWSEFRRPNA